MRVSVVILCVLICAGSLARADDDRPATIVGEVAGLDADATATITVYRLGSTELMDRPGVEPDESIVRTLDTGANGRYEIAGLEAGAYVLVAEQGSARVGEGIVRVFAGSRRELSLSLAPTRWLSGTLRWSDGRRVEGDLRVRLRRYGGRMMNGPYDPWWYGEPYSPSGPTLTPPLVDGRFRIGLPARRTDLSIELPDGSRILWSEPWGKAVEALEVAWTIPVPGETVEGRLLDEAGEPLDGATITATHRRDEGPKLATTATAGPDGRVRLAVVSAPALIAAVSAGCRRIHDPAFGGGDLCFERLGESRATIAGTVRLGDAPVAGAVVHAASGSHQGWRGEAVRAVTDADGRYRFTDLPSGPAAVFVRGGGFASLDLANVFYRGPNPFLCTLGAGQLVERDLVVERAARLAGRILDHAGEPVVGATLRAIGVNSARGGAEGFASEAAKHAHVGPFVATTDHAGRFAYRDLVPGHLLSMRIDAPGKTRLDTVVTPDGVAAETVLRFARPRFLTVRVIDEGTGASIPDAEIAFEQHPERGRTGPDGRALFGPFGDGRVQLRVRAETYVPVIDVEVPGSEGGPGPFEVTVALERGLTITGRVLDENGEALIGAHVHALHATQRRSGLQTQTSTDAAGRFVLSGLFPGTWQLGVHHLERVSGQTRNRQLEGEAEAGARDVILRYEAPPPRPTLEIRVVGPSGQPIPRAEAQLVAGGRRVAGAPVVEGRARLVVGPHGDEPLARGKAFVRVVYATDDAREPLPFGGASAGPVEVPGPVVRLTLPPEQRVTGRVLSPAGEPVVGAMVRAHQRLPGPDAAYDVAPLGARTDDAGRFAVRYLGPGPYVIEVDAGTRYLHAMEKAEAGAVDLEVRLVEALAPRVVVLGPGGRPLSGAMVRLEPSAADRKAQNEARKRGESGPRPGRYVPTTFETAADGSVVLQGLAPEHVVDLEIYSLRDDVQVAKFADWAPTSVEIRLERGIVIAGRLVDEEGEPVPDGIVAIEGGNLWSGKRCEVDGRFRFVRLAPGPYTLHAGRRGMAWQDPGVRTQIVEEGTERLIVEVAPR